MTLSRNVKIGGLVLWALITVALIVEVANLSALEDDTSHMSWIAQQEADQLGTLAWSLAKGMPKDSFAIHLRNFDPRDLSYPDDSSVVLGDMTFRFDTAGRFETILHLNAEKP